MPATAMNHFTIMTDDVEKTVAFYGRYLDLRSGPRPPFDFPGAWLYARDGSEAILHVLGGRDRERLVRGVIDHMAFTARDLGDVVALLEADGIEYHLRRLPDDGTWQLFFFDPNNARIELDFDAAEPGPAEAH